MLSPLIGELGDLCLDGAWPIDGAGTERPEEISIRRSHGRTKRLGKPLMRSLW